MSNFSFKLQSKLISTGLVSGFGDVQGIFVHYLVPLDELTIGGAQDAKKVVGKYCSKYRIPAL